MEHIRSADLKKIGGMFLERDQLCLLTHPNYYNNHVNSWELVNIPAMPPPALSPLPATPPVTPSY